MERGFEAPSPRLRGYRVKGLALGLTLKGFSLYQLSSSLLDKLREALVKP